MQMPMSPDPILYIYCIRNLNNTKWIFTCEAVENHLEEADHAEAHAEAHKTADVRDKGDRGRLNIPAQRVSLI